MTQQGYTHIVKLIDRSGSMASIKHDTEGGIKQFIAEQQALPGRCTVSVYTFDSEFKVDRHFQDIQEFGTFELKPRGSTALLDAWGKAITLTGEHLAALPESDRPEYVVFVVVTDGEENASQEWTREKVLASVKHQQEAYGWTFVFLAANQDAIQAGRNYGVAQSNSMNFNKASTRSAYVTTSSSVSLLRGGAGFAPMPEDAPES